MRHKPLILILLLLLLIVMPTAFALTTPVTVTTWTDNTTHQVNISHQTTNWTYSCDINQTATINIPYDCVANTTIIGCETVLQNLSNMMTKLLESDKDKKAYFDLYTTCNANLAVCNKEKEKCDLEANYKSKYETELPQCTTAKDQCVNTDLPNCVNDKQICINDKNKCVNTDLPKAKSDRLIYFLAGAGLAGGIFYVVYIKKKETKRPLQQDFETRE